jgi:sulfur relay (sulfurtransferase) DsrC/TusE family protein
LKQSVSAHAAATRDLLLHTHGAEVAERPGVAATHRAPASRYRHSIYQEWTAERAEATAKALGLRLGSAHWRVIGCARELWSGTRSPIDLDALAERVGMPVATMAALFRGPLADRLRAIAGIEE